MSSGADFSHRRARLYHLVRMMFTLYNLGMVDEQECFDLHSIWLDGR